MHINILRMIYHRVILLSQEVAMEVVRIKDQARTRQVQAVATNTRQRIENHLRTYRTQACISFSVYPSYVYIIHTIFLFI